MRETPTVRKALTVATTAYASLMRVWGNWRKAIARRFELISNFSSFPARCCAISHAIVEREENHEFQAIRQEKIPEERRRTGGPGGGRDGNRKKRRDDPDRKSVV